MKVRDIAKRFARSLVRAMPQNAVRFALQIAALAPPAMKTPLFESVFSRIAATSLPQSQELMETNLGISSKLRCDIPLAKASYLFGRPKNLISERSTLALVREFARDCEHFLDVGANDGLFTFLVSASSPGVEKRIHWFEPDSDLRDRLIKNLEANGVPAHGNCVAVSAATGVATFHKDLSDDSSGSISDYFTGKHLTRELLVDTITLNDYFRDREIRGALVKIDVEGAGCAVWTGASNIADRISYLVMEMLAPEIEKGLPAKIIADTGFRAYYIRDFELIEAPKGDFQYRAPFWNWLFCRLDCERLAKRLSGTEFQVVRAL